MPCRLWCFLRRHRHSHRHLHRLLLLRRPRWPRAHPPVRDRLRACPVQPLALGPVVLVAQAALQADSSKCCCCNKLPSPQPGNNPPNKWVAHLVVRGAMPQVARWVVWHPAAHLALTRLGCKWVAWAVPLAVRWVALRVGQWVVLAPVRWQVAWAHLVAQWVVPVPVRWPVAWARPVDKWAAWA